MKSPISVTFLIVAAVIQCQANINNETEGLEAPKPLVGPVRGISARSGYKYYYNTDRPMTWFAANYYCRMFDQDLVKIDQLMSSLEVQELLEFNGDNDKSFWSSGNNMKNSHQWLWGLEGESLGHLYFSNWVKNEPTDDPNRRCLVLEKVSLQWKQVDCGDNNHYVMCQDKYLPLENSPLPKARNQLSFWVS